MRWAPWDVERKGEEWVGEGERRRRVGKERVE